MQPTSQAWSESLKTEQEYEQKKIDGLDSRPDPLGLVGILRREKWLVLLIPAAMSCGTEPGRAAQWPELTAGVRIEDMPAIGHRTSRAQSHRRGHAMAQVFKPLGSMLKDRDHGWGPLIWLAVLGFLFRRSCVGPCQRASVVFRFLLRRRFLVLYMGFFWLQKPRAIVHIGGMALLGALLVPFNGGAWTFFIFAAALLPFCVEHAESGGCRDASDCGFGAIEGLLLHLYRLDNLLRRGFP